MNFDFTNETITLDATNVLTIGGTGGLEIPVGNTAARPSVPVQGTIRYNTDIYSFEIYAGSPLAWRNIGAPTLTTKGDLLTRDATSEVRLPVGTNGYMLVADSTTASGLRWTQDPVLAQDSLISDPTGFPNRTDTILSFNNSTRVFTISPASASFDIYQHGIKFTKTAAETVTISNTSGFHYIYYDELGILRSSSSFFQLHNDAPVATVYWNTIDNVGKLGDERHGIIMDWVTHLYLHKADGARYISGFDLGNYTTVGTGNSNSDVTIAIASGVMADEDIFIDIVDNASPTNIFEQTLSPAAVLPVVYRKGATGVYTWDTASSIPLKMGTTYPTWNEFTGTTWTTTEATSGTFIAMWVIATNTLIDPVIAVMGQNVSTTLADAMSVNTFGDLDIGIEFNELRPLYRLIFEVQGSYTNSVNAALRHIVDVRLDTIQTFVTGASPPGSVSLVGLSLPSIFTVTGSPVTSFGTLTGTLTSQNANTVFAGPTAGFADPTFRTLGLASNDISDVTISTAALGQVLTYNGTKWVNSNATSSAATANVGVTPTANGTNWSLVSGSIYTATFTHNLGTTDLSITCYDVLDNSVVVPHYITTPTSNTIVIQVYGNGKTLKIVAVANGLSISASGSTPSSVITQLNGSLVSSSATTLNFTGQVVGVTAASTTTTINVGSRFTYYANSLDSPNTADFAVNALAPVVTDPAYTSMVVRSFSNTAEQGVSTLLSIPLGATSMTFRIRGRTQTAPGTASNVQPRIYTRLLPDNSAVGAWSAGTNLSLISIPTNAYFQYYVYTATLSSLGMSAGNLYQLELTRYNTGVTNNLASNFYLAEMTLEIS